jgi:tetratricopeptide (TPR) repeat protein
VWIVVPFANDAKAQDVDWLRDASVNLLSLDLSRWSDVDVVDDKRVGDLLRELPSGRGGSALTLNDGLGLARRAGAGRLVMGDFVKLGKSLRIIANVFDAKTGERVRTVQQTTDADSLLGAFSPLARGVLAVPPPVDAKLGALGTSRVDAYREYLLGVTALNRFELTDAKQHLRQALVLDSTFALAHFKLAIAMHWDDDPDTTERVHALAAARLGAGLPTRERALISARVALANGEYERACEAVRGIVAKDSSDVEALYGVGECEYHGGRVPGVPIDSVHGRLRGNWNAAIAAFRRVLLIDPSYHPAFEHILNALTQERFGVCARQAIGCSNDPDAWNAFIIRESDSLVVPLIRSGAGAEVFAAQRRVEQTQSARLNKLAARKIAEEWVSAGPAEARAHLNLATVDLSLGDLDRAAAALRSSFAGADEYSRLEGLTDRAYVAILRGNGAEARALIDTLSRAVPAGSQRVGDVASLNLVVGRMAPINAAVRRAAARENWSPERLRYSLEMPRLVLGIPGDSAGANEHRYWSSLTSDTTCPAGLSRCRETALLVSLSYGLRLRRDWWPPFVVDPIGFRFEPAAAHVARNPKWLAESIQELDSVSRTRVRAGFADQATEVIAADAALSSGDTTKALELTRFFVDSVMPAMTTVQAGMAIAVGESLSWRWALVPRMMLMRADLAAATGSRDEAREWYAKVLSLWANADPELQPTVARIRASMTALGARR